MAGLENPTPYISGTNSAGGEAFGEATTIQNMKNQEESEIGGAVAGLALAPFTGGASLGFGQLKLPGGGGGSTAGQGWDLGSDVG